MRCWATRSPSLRSEAAHLHRHLQPAATRCSTWGAADNDQVCADVDAADARLNLQPTDRCPTFNLLLRSIVGSTAAITTIGGAVAAAIFAAASLCRDASGNRSSRPKSNER